MRTYLLLLLTVAIACLFLPSVASAEWGQYQGDAANTGVGEEGPPAEAWTFELDRSVSSTVVVSGDSVYFLDDQNTLYSVDRTASEVQWRRETRSENGPQVILNTPILSDGRLYLVDQDRGVAAVDESGEDLWQRYPRDGPRTELYPVSVPAVGDGSIAFAMGDELYAVDAEFGGIRWSSEIHGEAMMPVGAGEDFYVPGYVRDEDITPPEGALTRLGSAGDRRLLHDGNALSGPPAVGDGKLFTGDFQGIVRAVEAESGAEEWSVRTGGTVAPPALRDGAVYVGSDDGAVYALDATTGEKLWRFDTPSRADYSPAVSEDTVYAVTDRGGVYGIDRGTGDLDWGVRLPGGIAAPPAVFNGSVYVASGSTVYSISEGEVDGEAERVTSDELPDEPDAPETDEGGVSDLPSDVRGLYVDGEETEEADSQEICDRIPDSTENALREDGYDFPHRNESEDTDDETERDEEEEVSPQNETRERSSSEPSSPSPVLPTVVVLSGLAVAALVYLRSG